MLSCHGLQKKAGWAANFCVCVYLLVRVFVFVLLGPNPKPGPCRSLRCILRTRFLSHTQGGGSLEGGVLRLLQRCERCERYLPNKFRRGFCGGFLRVLLGALSALEKKEEHLLKSTARFKSEFGSFAAKIGNGRNTVSRVLFRRRELTEPH